jgi:cell wall-associated NlpC family hydrolase
VRGRFPLQTYSFFRDCSRIAAACRLRASETAASLPTSCRPRLPGSHVCQRNLERRISPRKRQARGIVIAFAAALIAGGAATANPGTVASKQAQAQQVLDQINSIDRRLEGAIQAFDGANWRLGQIKVQQKQNRHDLKVARSNLKHAQAAVSSRLVAIYTADTDNSTIDVILGAKSLDEILNRLDTASRVSAQATQVIGEVHSFKALVKRERAQLKQARIDQERLVVQRRAQKAHIESQLAQRRALLASIKGQIAQLQVQEHSRQLALARQAQERFQSQPINDTVIGASASTPEGAAVVPPSQYGGVVGVAMKYLGTPYVYGGATPGGFDCSGFVAYVFGQMGVALPHYSGAQYGYGAAVPRDQLQPGDLVFFDGLGHVGIYIGGGQFVHAPHTGDVVKISSLSESWYASTYVGARRIG